MEDFRLVITCVIVVQALLLSGSLWMESRQFGKGSSLLGMFTLFLALHFTNIYLAGEGFTEIRLNLIFCFSYGPLIWLYARSISETGFTINKSTFTHFIPSLSIIFIKVFSLNELLSFENYLLYSVSFIQPLSYIAAAVYLLRKSEVLNEELLSAVYRFLGLFTLVLISGLLDYLRWAVSWNAIESISVNSLFVVSFVFINVLLFEKLKSSTGFSTLSLLREYKVPNGTLDSIELYFKTERLYLRQDLTISKVAKELHTPAYIISRAINKHYKKNFNHFVNDFRVKEAKRLLVTTDLKILAIAFEAGFSNKTSFNRVFKQHVGFSPSEYRKHSISSNN